MNENKKKDTQKERKDDLLKNLNKGGKPGDSNKGKFNFYWIYMLIAAVFFALFFFNRNGETQETTWNDLRQMLIEEDIEKIVVVNNEIAEIFIKQDKIGKQRYDKLRESVSNNFLAQNPHYKIVIGSVETFDKRLKRLRRVSIILFILNMPEGETGVAIS